MAHQVVDLSKGNGGGVLVREEEPDERTARLAQEAADADSRRAGEAADAALRREKERVAFYALGAVYLLLVLTSTYHACWGNDTVAPWARGIVGALIAALGGFVTGKSTK